MKSIRALAHGKVNLHLTVLGRRPDGFHDLETLFQAVNLCDELIVRAGSNETRLEVPGHDHLETQDNLVIQALRWLEGETDKRLPVNIHLTKRIPEAAGLGGGSADAAGTLIAVNALFDLGLDTHDLARGALSLGADVPFFLVGGSAIGEGVGEKLTPVRLEDGFKIILVNPGFRVPTAQVFQEMGKTLTARKRSGKLRQIIEKGGDLRLLLHNDLQPVTERLYPEVRRLRNHLQDAGVTQALMTGSGPTVFGLTESDARQVEQIIEDLPNEWWSMVTLPVNHGIMID